MSVRQYITKAKELLFFLVAFMIACYIYMAPAIIALYIITWAVEGNLKEKLTTAIRNKYVIIFCSFYLLHLIGMLYSSNQAFGWFDLEVKASLFIFPLILASEGKMGSGKQKNFTMGFTAGLVINGLICLGVAFWRLWAENVFMFQYKDFSLFLHPSYYSMYIDVALVLIFYVLTEKDIALKRKEKAYLYASVFFLEFMLVLLQSKTGLIVSLIIFSVIILRYALKKGPWITSISIVVGVAVLYVLSYHYIITSGRSRILSAETILAKDKLNAASTESTQVRLFVWHAAWEVIKENPLVGTGTGDVKDVLVSQYAKDGVMGAYKERLNAHDEYIQCTVALGFIGLFVLLSCLLLPLIKSLKEHRFVYTMFIVIIMINFLTESMLETQGGTMFYGFFNSILMFNFVI